MYRDLARSCIPRRHQQRIHNMLKTLSRLFTLKPYGNHLIDGMTELWLFLAAVNIVSIALCDAIAWAYFGYTTSQGAAAYITAGLAGIIVFTLVGSLDAMFIMHDRSERTGAWRERAARLRASAAETHDQDGSSAPPALP